MPDVSGDQGERIGFGALLIGVYDGKVGTDYDDGSGLPSEGAHWATPKERAA